MNVLIISFYGPPANNIAADRIAGYLKYLPLNHVQTNLITRYYDPQSFNNADMRIGLSETGLLTDFVSKDNIYYTNYDTSNKWLSISKLLPPGLRGYFNLKKVDVYHAGWEKYVYKVISRLQLEDKKIDYVILSYGPPVVLKLAKYIHHKFGLKCILEFRDSYITEEDKGRILKVKQKILNDYCKDVKAFIFASEGIASYFNVNVNYRLKSIPTHVLYHGFDSPLADDNFSITERNAQSKIEAFLNKKKVVAIFPGTLYSGQNIDFFIDGMNLVNKIDKNNMGICFLGSYFDSRIAIEESENIILLPKVSKYFAIEIMKKCQLLLLPVWNNRYSGFSGKVSEYCALNKFIGVSPNPQNDLKFFLESNPNAIFFSNTTSLVEFILQLCKKEINPITLDSKIYSKKEYFKRLADFLSKI